MSKLISIGNIIDYSWEHYTTHFKILMRISLWLFLVTALSMILLIASPSDFSGLQNIDLTAPSKPLDAGTLTVGISQFVVTAIIAPIVGVWIFLTLLQAMKLQQAGKKVDTKAVGKNSWKIFFSYAWVALLKGLAILLPLLLVAPGVILLIYNTAGPQIPWLSGLGMLLTFIGVILALIGVIYATVVFNFAEYKLVFEGMRGLKAMKAAKEMVKNRFFGTLVRILLPKIVFAIPLIILQVILAVALTLLLPSVAGAGAAAFLKISQIGDNLISTGLAVLSTPLFILADYYVYDSLRKNAS